jgi:hypothetical protein
MTPEIPTSMEITGAAAANLNLDKIGLDSLVAAAIPELGGYSKPGGGYYSLLLNSLMEGD